MACGRLDAFWEINLNPWDVAAGMLMVTEAGGRVSEMRGGACTLGCAWPASAITPTT